MNQPKTRFDRGPATRRRRLAIGALVVGGLGRRRMLAAAGVIGLALAGAACGGGSAKAGVASLSTTTTTSRAVAVTTGGSSPLVEYATCMRSHGISGFPEAASFGSSDAIKAAKGQMARISQSEAFSPTFEAAQRACARYYGPTAPPQHVSPQEMQKLIAVSRCMRAHGVSNFPDPDPTNGELNAPANIDRSSPQVVGALRACSSLGRAAGLGPPNTGR